MSFKDLPEGKTWKYAQTEMERRFLLKSRPAWVQDRPCKKIRDKYLFQTNMRVRATSDGETRGYN